MCVCVCVCVTILELGMYILYNILIRTPMGQKKCHCCEVSSFQRLKCMQEWYVYTYILGVGKGALFREVSSVQECPHRERDIHTQNNYIQYLFMF